jgi:hypothetical protein
MENSVHYINTKASPRQADIQIKTFVIFYFSLVLSFNRKNERIPADNQGNRDSG